MDFHEDLMFPGLTVADRGELLEVLGNAVINAGFAKDTYVDALKERERDFPTGLPISGGVAIPHTAAEYVHVNTIVAASLTNPVSFAEMGGEEDSVVPVSAVFLLVFADSSQHVPLLSKLVGSIQDETFVDSVRQAGDKPTMARLLAEQFAA